MVLIIIVICTVKTCKTLQGKYYYAQVTGKKTVVTKLGSAPRGLKSRSVWPYSYCSQMSSNTSPYQMEQGDWFSFIYLSPRVKVLSPCGNCIHIPRAVPSNRGTRIRSKTAAAGYRTLKCCILQDDVPFHLHNCSSPTFLCGSNYHCCEPSWTFNCLFQD